MDAIEIDHTTTVRPSEDDVCSSLRMIDPWGAEVVAVMPQPVLAKVLPHYKDARETVGADRATRRRAQRAWTVAVQSIIRGIRSGDIVW